MPDVHPTAPLAPLDIGACIRERLRERHPHLKVYGVLDLAVGKPKLRVPCVAVLPLQDELEEVVSPDPDVAVVQRMKTTVATVVGVPCPNDLGGTKGKAADELVRHLAPVRESLLGWPPGGPFPIDPLGQDVDPPTRPLLRPAPGWHLMEGRPEPLVWRRGRLVLMADGRAWWQDEYSTRWLVASAERAEDASPFGAVRQVCAQVAVPQGAEPETVPVMP